MKTTTLLIAFFLGSASAFAPAHPHIHLARRQTSNSTTNTTSVPTELSTSFIFASTAVPTTLATSVLSTSATTSSTAPSTSSSVVGQSVTVKSGDTLEKIAAANNVGICDIAKVNNISDPNLIIEGQTLSIPVAAGEKDDVSCL